MDRCIDCDHGQSDCNLGEQNQIDADAFYDLMADYYDWEHEANLVSWGVESLEDIDHDW